MADAGLRLYGREGKRPVMPPAADVLAATLPVAPVTPQGAPNAVTIPELTGRVLTALEFSCQRNGSVNSGGTASGFDNSTVLQNYANWCRDNGRTLVLPPGNYYLTKPLTVYTDFYAAGARLLFPSNIADPNRVIIENRPEDVLTIPLSEVKAWTGCTKLSRKIGGLTGRKGQYIVVDTPDEALINRRGENPGDAPIPLRMGEGFLVNDDTGGLAHSLYATWNNAAWTSAGSYTAKIVRAPIKIEGLSVVLCNDGTSTVVNAPVLNRRPNVIFSNCSVENVSGVQVAQGFSDEGCCLVTHEDGWVKGLLVVSTNYGWNSNLCAGLVYRRPKEINCRRGIDAHRGKNITIESPDLPDGWGAHYSWWIGSSGGTLGASTANNPQAINVAGGGFFCSNARVSISGDATAFARIRADYMECDEQIDLSGCVVDFAVQAAGVSLIDAVGTSSAYDFGRDIRYPARIDLTRLIVNLNGPATQILYPVNWLRAYNASDLPRKIGVDSAWDIDFKVNLGTGTAFLANGTTPRIQIGYNKPSQAIGASVSARVRNLPALALTAYAPADAVTATARLTATLSQIPTAFLRYGPGGYQQITTDATSLDAATLSNASGFTPIGDEAILTGARAANGQLQPEAALASAATTDLGKTFSARIAITGTTSITSFGTAANRFHILRFTGALTLTHNATSLILPGGGNILTAAGDTAIIVSDTSGNWRVVNYQRASSGAPWATYTPTFTPSGGSGVAVTLNRASYEISGKTLRLQVRFTVTFTSAPNSIAISLPSGIAFKDGSAGSVANFSSGGGGYSAGAQGGTTVNAQGGTTVWGGSGSAMVVSIVGEIV